MKKNRGLLVVSVLLTSLVGAGLARAEQPEPTGNTGRGKQLYFQHGCYACHGYGGQTGAQKLVGTGSPIVENLDLFRTFLRLRAEALLPFPATNMPNYAESSLSDAAVRDLFAYVRSFKLDAPRAEDTAALRAIVDSVRHPSH